LPIEAKAADTAVRIDLKFDMAEGTGGLDLLTEEMFVVGLEGASGKDLLPRSGIIVLEVGDLEVGGQDAV